MRGSQKNRDYRIKWAPSLAYAVGLITTDGNLSKDGRHMALVSKDVQLLKTFKKCLGLDNQIGVRKGGFKDNVSFYHVQFSNVMLYRWLLSIGLIPNKTKIINTLKIPDKYFFDFLRGHFDGDGSCYSYWDKRWNSSFMFYITFLSASKNHVLWIQSRIKNLIHINGHLTVMGRTPLYGLRYAKNESRILISQMYYQKDLPCLQRKYKKIEGILEKDLIENKREGENKNGRVMEPVDIYA